MEARSTSSGGIRSLGKFMKSKDGSRRGRAISRAVGAALYRLESLEDRTLLSAHHPLTEAQLLHMSRHQVKSDKIVRATNKTGTATAVIPVPTKPVEFAIGDPQPIVNGVVYSAMTLTSPITDSVTGGVIGYDDYDSINNAPITLTSMRFRGGVNVVNGTLFFDFYDSSLAYQTGFSVSLPSTGTLTWTINLGSGITIPDAGYMLIESDTGVAGNWVRNTFGPTVGTQNYGLGSPPSSTSYRFEFTNTSPNQAPTIASLSDTPDPIALNGNVTLTANSVADVDGTVASVAFYRESNGITGLQVGGDTLLQTVNNPGPYSYVYNTTGLGAGIYTYYAQATDNLAFAGNVAQTTNTIGFGTVTGTKWSDVDSDGVFDGGEPTLPGVTVYVDYNDNSALDGGEPSAVTNGSGVYTISNVTPGTYNVREVVPGGTTQTYPGAFGALTQGPQVTATPEPEPEPISNALLYVTPIANWTSTSATPTGPLARPVWAPGTSQKEVDDYYAANTLTGGPSAFTFADSARWSRTATNGSGLVQGQSTTLTWRIVNDGTPIPALGGISGESSASSNLQSFLTGIYGSSAVWLALFQQIFNSWSAVTGINYVMESTDDNSTFSNIDSGATQGVLGTRADIRIGGHALDGNSNVLAYNFFPGVGEMIIDTSDNFFSNTSSGSLGLRNVLAHEHGHGIGLQHVMPVSQTKLMEPFVSFAFDGPQFDDILAANRGYGDRLEQSGGNDTSVLATNLGALVNGTNSTTTVSIDDDSDTDFYKFTAASAKRATITVAPSGTQYLSGPQSGSPPPSIFDAAAQSDLTVQLLASDGVTVLRTGNVTGIGQAETLFSVPLNAGGQFYIKVTGTANAAQMYSMSVTIADAAAGAYNLQIAPGQTISNINFGNHVNATGSIAGQVFEDRLSDGLINGGDVGLNGVTVYLDTNNNASLDGGEPSVTTSGSGNFSFTGLAAGTYHLRHTVPTGYVATLPTTGAIDVVVAAGAVTQNLADFPRIYTGTGTDVYLLRLDAGTQTKDEILLGGVLTYSALKSLLPSLTFNAGANDDSFTLDRANGDPIPTGGVFYDGGAGALDSLIVSGTSTANTVTLVNANVGPNAGNLAINDPTTGAQTVENFTFTTISGVISASQRMETFTLNNAIVTLAQNGSRVINTNALNLNGASAKLDLKDNDMVVRSGTIGAWNGTNYTGLTGDVKRGYNSGAWNGNGIVTSMSSATLTRARTTLGVSLASDAFNIGAAATATFGTETVTGSSVLIKYTWMGDANLSGKITGDDYFKVDSVFPSHLTGYTNGDFDFNGKVNADDYFWLDLTYVSQGAPQ